jgi:hypothetical protein
MHRSAAVGAETRFDGASWCALGSAATAWLADIDHLNE